MAKSRRRGEAAEAVSEPASGQAGTTGTQAPRRQRGNPKVFKRADGRYAVWLELGYVDGKRQKRALYGKTKAEALDKYRDAVAAKRDGLPQIDRRSTVAVLFQRWLGEVVKPNRAPRTYDGYLQYAERHILPDLGRIRLMDLTPATVQEWVNRKASSGLAPRTVTQLRAILRAALNRAIKWRLLVYNPAAQVDLPRAQVARDGEESAASYLTPDQYRTFVRSLASDRLEALYVLAATTGMRQGEVLGLRWQDIDLEAGEVRVRQTLVRVREQGADGKFHQRLIFGVPKTEKSRRTLALPDATAEALIRHRDRQDGERTAAGARWQDSGLVFTTPIGTPIDPSNLIREYHQRLASADVPRVRFHDLRHTFASLLAAEGADLHEIMGALGHSQVALTAKLYTHLLPSVRRKSAARIDGVLTPKPQPLGVSLGVKGAGRPARKPALTLSSPGRPGAPGGARTLNPRIKSPLLCH
jgi:integrase